MQIGSIGGYSGLWAYKYQNAAQAGSEAFAEEITRQITQADDADAGMAVLGPDDAGGEEPSSYQKKVQSDQAYREELAEAKVNDPEKYYEMVTQRRKDIAKSFSQLEEMAGKSDGAKSGSAEYNGVVLNFDFENRAITVGDMSGGDVIHVGRLSNGYSFSFSRDSIDAITGILDLFSPEDINRIMEAITMDNMKDSMEQEVEDTEAKAAQTAENAQDENEVRGSGAQEDGGEAQALQQSSLLDRLLADRDARTEASGGTGGGAMGASGEEESETTSEIVVNSDGTRNLIITTKVGGEEIETKIPLSPLKQHNEYHRQKGTDAYEQQLDMGVFSSYPERGMTQGLETA